MAGNESRALRSVAVSRLRRGTTDVPQIESNAATTGGEGVQKILIRTAATEMHVEMSTEDAVRFRSLLEGYAQGEIDYRGYWWDEGNVERYLSFSSILYAEYEDVPTQE